MIKTLKVVFYKNGYLLIVAVVLYLISFIFSNYWFYASSPVRVQKELETFLQNGEQKFESFSADSAVLNAIIINKREPLQALQYTSEDVGLFAYTANDQGDLSLSFWNNNKVLPESRDLKKSDGKYFSTYPNGEFEFIKKTFYLKDKSVVTVALIPIYWNYFFKNNYLQSGFPANENIAKRYEIVSSNARFYIKTDDGKPLFGLKEKKRLEDKSPGDWSLALRILAVIFVLIFINVAALDTVQSKGWVKGLLVLIVPVFLIRVLSYYFPFPFEFRNLPLFDPAIYASNKLHPSLGDLLINVILLFWIISFVKYVAINSFKNIRDIKGKKGWWVTSILCVFLIVLSFTFAGIIRSLIIDSKISFDVTNFFSLTIYSLLSFIILCFIILTFFHISHIVVLFIYKCIDVPDYGRYVIIATAGLFYLTITLNSPSSLSNVIVLLWLLVYIFIIEFRKEDIFVPILRSSFFLIWIIFFAVSISALIIYQNRYVEFTQRKQAAEKLAVQSDPSAETLMSIGITNINNDFLSKNFNRFKNETANKAIKDSLINENFSGYLNKYDTRLYTYDRFYHPLFNDDSVSFGAVSSIITNRSKPTTSPDLYYYENEYNEFSYLYKKEIRGERGNIQGYFFVVAELKKYKSEALYPELFKQVENVETDLNVNYAYAVYNKGKIINNYGDYDFKSRIPKQDYPKQEFLEKVINGKSVLWYNAGNNKLVIIVRSGSIFFEAITLFAYLFGSFLFIVVLFQVGHLLVQNKFRLNQIKNNLRFDLRAQIQSAIIFLSLFSFLVIGISTISFYISRFRQTNRDRLVKAIEIMANEVQNQIANHSIFDDVLKNSEASENSWLETTIKEISEIHSLDANFYDINGNLKVSTQPYLYKKQILSQMMEPKAFYRLHYNNNIEVIQNENVSLFSFLSIYIPIKDASGESYAYLNIPYLNTQKELNQEISNFLVTLINLNAFIFVIAGAISVLLTNRITGSFTLIASKMRDINLGRANEEIVWNTNDEIGALIKEYNKMVKKLDESAQALAKSEREGAWREMARQVAHEIKNPLTPMKLSIQYLQRAIQDKNPNVEAMSRKVSATLVEQIDQLAKIASDFSQFANIGNVKVEVFDVNEVLGSLINLYSANTRLQITYNRSNQPAVISADRTQINRLFTNLFQNAIEASDGQQTIPIIVSQEINANKLLINITDNGCGIPVEMQEKIFTPNFTTKTSGTGLGLAMCKGIVEKANGRIWFETIEGKGTSFHVLLPLVGLPE
ncbi:sensor histidine kinase [Segetibacter koreensis]|uniref:sensor histidine kinase n=1 Tax=Segetibacter koreensis TaxID=398037 RepID=UPI000375CF62|nr:HAMP domain-containing sensor histidine kinase [Segetibacter koreensis]